MNNTRLQLCGFFHVKCWKMTKFTLNIHTARFLEYVGPYFNNRYRNVTLDQNGLICRILCMGIIHLLRAQNFPKDLFLTPRYLHLHKWMIPKDIQSCGCCYCRSIFFTMSFTKCSLASFWGAQCNLNNLMQETTL